MYFDIGQSSPLNQNRLMSRYMNSLSYISVLMYGYYKTRARLFSVLNIQGKIVVF